MDKTDEELLDALFAEENPRISRMKNRANLQQATTLLPGAALAQNNSNWAVHDEEDEIDGEMPRKSSLMPQTMTPIMSERRRSTSSVNRPPTAETSTRQRFRRPQTPTKSPNVRSNRTNDLRNAAHPNHQETISGPSAPQAQPPKRPLYRSKSSRPYMPGDSSRPRSRSLQRDPGKQPTRIVRERATSPMANQSSERRKPQNNITAAQRLPKARWQRNPNNLAVEPSESRPRVIYRRRPRPPSGLPLTPDHRIVQRQSHHDVQGYRNHNGYRTPIDVWSLEETASALSRSLSENMQLRHSLMLAHEIIQNQQSQLEAATSSTTAPNILNGHQMKALPQPPVSVNRVASPEEYPDSQETEWRPKSQIGHDPNIPPLELSLSNNGSPLKAVKKVPNGQKPRPPQNVKDLKIGATVKFVSDGIIGQATIASPPFVMNKENFVVVEQQVILENGSSAVRNGHQKKSSGKWERLTEIIRFRDIIAVW